MGNGHDTHADGMAVRVDGLSRTFGTHRALDNVSLEVRSGEMVALIGPSGSGKSTLLRHLTGLERGDAGAGHIEVLGRATQRGGRVSGDVRRVRREVGFIFQQYNLVGRLSLLTNVLAGTLGRLPAWRGCTGWFTLEEKREAMAALDRVGIAAQAGQRAGTLSGGQQQRGAIARTMVQRAAVILADEPIASLDPGSCREVMDALQVMNRERGVTVLVSLHQIDYAKHYCPRAIALKDGVVVFDGPSAELDRESLVHIYGRKMAEFHLNDEENRGEPDPMMEEAKI